MDLIANRQDRSLRAGTACVASVVFGALAVVGMPTIAFGGASPAVDPLAEALAAHFAAQAHAGKAR